jgi:hypothetical protein
MRVHKLHDWLTRFFSYSAADMLSKRGWSVEKDHSFAGRHKHGLVGSLGDHENAGFDFLHHITLLRINDGLFGLDLWE